MQKIQSSFKITLLLYILVLILPFSFYYVYKSFDEIQNDTRIVRLVSWTGGAMEHLTLAPSNENNKQLIREINKTLQNISDWVVKNDDSELYIGATKLSEDFSAVESCWNAYLQKSLEQNQDTLKQQMLHCYSLVEELAIIIEKMVYLKQDTMINLFYLSLLMLMIFLFVTIYLMRVYIHAQMKKHAIRDHETKLFNQKYFLAELKTSCARAIRQNSPLSLLAISIDEFEEESKKYDTKIREHILFILGGLITSLTRESDVACRYDENHFSILLPDTTEKNALILESRIREAFEKHDFSVSPELNFTLSTAQFDYKETPESFVARTQKEK